MQITEDRKKWVIDLYFNQRKTYVEIAKIERMSIRDISDILKEEDATRQKYHHQQKQDEISSKAYKLFSEESNRSGGHIDQLTLNDNKYAVINISALC